MASITSNIGIMFLFIWISFFAPLIGARYQYLFIVTIICTLLSLIVFHKANIKLIFDKKDLPFWIFLLAMIGGLVNIIDSKIAHYHFWYYIFPIPFIYFFTKVIFRKEHILLILRSICLMALAVSIYGFVEYITRKNFIYKDLIKNFCYPYCIGKRMMSTHVHPAPLGTYLVAIFPLSLGLCVMEKKKIFKFIAIICSVTICTASLFTFSRGVLLALIVEMFLIVFFFVRKEKVFYIYVLLFPILVIIIGSIFNFLDCRYGLIKLTQFDIYYKKIARFLGAGMMIKDHPFFGVGLGHYRVLFDHYLYHYIPYAKYVIYSQKIADCMYVTILAETGIIGFGGFVFFIGTLFKNMYKILKFNLIYENRLVLSVFFTGFCGIMCTFLTYDALYWVAPGYIFWSYAGILSCLIAKEEGHVKCK